MKTQNRISQTVKKGMTKEFKKTEEQTVFFKIENFIPERVRVGRFVDPRLIESIKKTMFELNPGQSFFIPKTTTSVHTIRKVVKEQMKRKEYKDCDIRTLEVKNTDIKGTRVCRFI